MSEKKKGFYEEFEDLKSFVQHELKDAADAEEQIKAVVGHFDRVVCSIDTDDERNRVGWVINWPKLKSVRSVLVTAYGRTLGLPAEEEVVAEDEERVEAAR